MSYFACHVKKFKSNDVRGLQIHNQRESSNSKNNDIDSYRTILNYDLHNKDKINYNQRIKEIIAKGYKGTKAIRKDATVMTSTIVTSDKLFFDKLSLKGVASGKCGFHTLRAFSPLIPMVCRLFRYSKVYIVP